LEPKVVKEERVVREEPVTVVDEVAL